MLWQWEKNAAMVFIFPVHQAMIGSQIWMLEDAGFFNGFLLFRLLWLKEPGHQIIN